MLSLSDPDWVQFRANYTDGRQVAKLLERAESGEPLVEWHEDLFQEICHQYTVSEAAYPAAPHLVRLATVFAEYRLHLLVLLGACHAYAEPSKALDFPADIEEGWHTSAREAIPLIAELLSKPQRTESDLRYLLSSLAAVQGYPSLASAIEGLDSEVE
jgi:hypothetical protein